MTTVDEYRRGRSGDLGTRKLQYIVRDTSSDEEVEAALKAQTLGTRNGKKRGKIEFEEMGGTNWLATVEYNRIQNYTHDVNYEFSYQAPQAKILFSIRTLSSHVRPDDTEEHMNWHQAINVTTHGVENIIEGVDLPSPNQTNIWTFFPPSDFVTQGYEMLVENLEGKVSNASFMGREAGTMRFVSCHGAVRRSKGTDDEDWEIHFGFHYSPHRYDVTVGDIVIPFVGGHNLLWVYYADEPDLPSLRMTKKPKYAYVEQIYEEANLSELGFGF